MNLTEENFDKIKKDALCLVYFWATWSGPCLNDSSIEELYKENQIPIYKVNVEENQDLSRKYSILVIPSLLFFKKGKLVKTLIGTHEKLKINEVIKQLV